jgi:pimeloyl-ACP methyl ester carboxylesterase
VLVGHGYGGMVITTVAARAPERLAHLVYLDAFVPASGQPALDLLPPERRAALLEQARAAGDGWRIPPPPPELYGVTREDDLRWVRPRLGPQPLRSLEQPLRAEAAPGAALPRTFVACTERHLFRRFADRARAEPGWRYRELATGHDAMITQPHELAGLLLETARP